MAAEAYRLDPLKSEQEKDYSEFLVDFILPIKSLPHAKLKALKITARDQEGCEVVCTLCYNGLRSIGVARTHVKSKAHRTKLKEKQLDLFLKKVPCPSPRQLVAMTEAVEGVYREQSAVAQGQIETRQSIGSELQELLRQEFPEVTVDVFGSSASGFALISSNVNLSIDLPGIDKKMDLIPSVMKRAVDILSTHSKLYTNIKEDFFSYNKIPRILFTHKKSDLTCEIRALAGNPMGLARLLSLYGSLDERVRKLGVAFRYWAKICSVDQQWNGHYPSHMYLVMMIHFLQQREPPVLPVLHQEGASPPEEEAKKKWERDDDVPTVDYLNTIPEIMEKWKCTNNETLGELWHALFRYYMVDFNIKMGDNAVTIRQLEPLKRLPKSWGTARLAVEDPLIPRSNLARAACSERVFSYLMTSLKQTFFYFTMDGPSPKHKLSQLAPSAIPTTLHGSAEERKSGEDGHKEQELDGEGQQQEEDDRTKESSGDFDTLPFAKQSPASSLVVPQTDPPVPSLRRLEGDTPEVSIVETIGDLEATESNKQYNEVPVRPFPESSDDKSSPAVLKGPLSDSREDAESLKHSTCNDDVTSVKPLTPAKSSYSDVDCSSSAERSSIGHNENNIEHDDNSIIFAAFPDLESPATSQTKQRDELDISFENECLLGSSVDEKATSVYMNRLTSTSNVASHVTFGSFSDESDESSSEPMTTEKQVAPTQDRRQETVEQRSIIQKQNLSDICSTHLGCTEESGGCSLAKDSKLMGATQGERSAGDITATSKIATGSTMTTATSAGVTARETDMGAPVEVRGTSEGEKPCEIPERSGPTTELQLQQEPEPSQNKYHFSKNNFVILDFPKACINCKKIKHVAEDCPEDSLCLQFSGQLPQELPPRYFLREMRTAFTGFMRLVTPKEQQVRLRQDICDSILADIRRVYPDVRMELFGSSANGFGHHRSDLDLCMMMGDDQEYNKSEVIEVVAGELERRRDKYDRIVAITNARVPIVRFYLVRWFLEADISLENRLALRNTKMLAAYAHMDQRVRVLGYTLKHMAKVCDMGDASSGSLSSYAYILLLLHYLQRTTPPVIPVLQQLYPHGAGKCTGPFIDSWDCYYFEFKTADDLRKVWPHYGHNKQSVGELWLGFLRYFVTEFDWTRHVVTIKQLKPLTKFDKWWLGKVMCIEDPFNLDHNLAAAISNRMRIYILERFQAALCYHSEKIEWMGMPHLMDREALIGESRSPKFMICLHCNARGHMAKQCPSKNTARGVVKPTRRSRPSARKTPQKDGEIKARGNPGNEARTGTDSGQPISSNNVFATETNELHEKRRQKKQERHHREQLLEDIPVPVPPPSPHQRQGPLLQAPRGVTRAPLLPIPDYRQKIGSSFYQGHGIRVVRRQEQPQPLYSSSQPVGGTPPHSLYPSGQPVGGTPPQSLYPSGQTVGGTPPQSLYPSGQPVGTPPQSLYPSGQPVGGTPPQSLHSSGQPVGGTPTQVIYPSGQPVGTHPQHLYLQGHPMSATPRPFYQSGQPVGTPTQVLFSSGVPAPVNTTPQFLYSSDQPVGTPPQRIYQSGLPMRQPSQPLYSSSQPVGAPPQSIYPSGLPMSPPSQPLYSSSQPVGGTPPQRTYQSGLPMSPPSQPLYSSGQPVGTPPNSLYSSGQPPPAYPSGPTYLQSYPPTPSDSFGALQHNHLPVYQSAHSFIPSSVAPYRPPLAQYQPNEVQQHSGPFYHDGFFDPHSLSRTPHDNLPNRKSYPHN